jgi:hypothetical protein
MDADAMDEVADLIHVAVTQDRDVREAVHSLRGRHPCVRYGFGASDL